MGGIAADALQIAFDPSSTVPTVGASGAIAAVLGAYLVLFPRARVRTLVFLLVFITWVELPAVVVLGAWFLLQLFSGVGSVGEQGSSVAYWAHVGGFAFGYLVAQLFYRDRRTGRPRRRAGIGLGSSGDELDQVVETVTRFTILARGMYATPAVKRGRSDRSRGRT